MTVRKLALQMCLGVMAVSLLAAKGCTLDGDASLGDDEKPDPSAGAGMSASTAGAAGKSSTNVGTAGKSATNPGAAGEPAVGGKSSTTGGSSTTGDAGEPATAGGAPSADLCSLPAVTGPCDANFMRYAFKGDHCELFQYGGCEGNQNNFATLAECQAACGDAATCPSHLLTLVVYEVAPLNRPEMACIVYDKPLHVGCSQLINPTLTVPTNWPTNSCATKAGKLYLAQTTLPKADGWQDCAPYEQELVNGALDCADLP